MVKRKVENSENESVANYSEINWAETLKWINVHKRKTGDSSRKCEVLLGVICVNAYYWRNRRIIGTI